MTKKEQKVAAWEAYKAVEKPALEAWKAIQESAWEDYEAELKRIDNEPDEDIIEVKGKRYQHRRKRS